MMNYSNLSDVDFEYLCQDIMTRKLNIHLERFASGRDGVTTVSELATVIDATVRGFEGDYIESILRKLPKDIELAIPFDENDLEVYSCEELAETYFTDDESNSDGAGDQSDDNSEIERMFER